MCVCVHVCVLFLFISALNALSRCVLSFGNAPVNFGTTVSAQWLGQRLMWTDSRISQNRPSSPTDTPKV